MGACCDQKGDLCTWRIDAKDDDDMFEKAALFARTNGARSCAFIGTATLGGPDGPKQVLIRYAQGKNDRRVRQWIAPYNLQGVGDMERFALGEWRLLKEMTFTWTAEKKPFLGFLHKN